MQNGNGVVLSSPQERLRQRLDDPQTAETLLQILDKLDVVALGVTSVDGFLRRGDEIIENISESVHDVRGLVPQGELGVQRAATILGDSLPILIEALPQLTTALPHLLHLTQRLNDPATREALDQILNNLGLAAFALEAADGFLQRSDIVIDSVADGVHDATGLLPEDALTLLGTLTDALPRLAVMLPQLLEALPQLTALLPLLTGVITQLQTILESAEFDALMSSGVFSPKTVGIVGQAGNALVDSYEAQQVQPQQVGMFGLVAAIRDPDVQRGLGFLVDFGKRFGQAMHKHH